MDAQESPRRIRAEMTGASYAREALTAVNSGEIPLYRHIAGQIRERVNSGQWKPGERIPTEKEFVREFKASQGTIRLAILELVKAGVLRRRQGQGTFVVGPNLENSFSRFFPFRQLGSDTPIVFESRTLKAHVVRADREVARAFGLPEREAVGHLRRLRSFEGEPVLLIDSYFPMAVWERIEEADFGVPLLYDLLARHDIHIVRADEFLRVDVASAREAALLKVARGAAIIRIERHAYTFRDRLVEFRRSTGRGDRFEYHARL